MVGPSATLERGIAQSENCVCFGQSPPMPLGCGTCGHAPYAHACSRQHDHEYVPPSSDQAAERLATRRAAGPQPLPRPTAPTAVTPSDETPALVPSQRRRNTVISRTRPTPHRPPNHSFTSGTRRLATFFARVPEVRAMHSTAPKVPDTWRYLTSDVGRLWAWRKEAFDEIAQEAGATPAVDADDLAALARAINRQERIAEQAGEERPS
ncbi:hypothetical protein [Herbidospora sp. RD11066]